MVFAAIIALLAGSAATAYFPPTDAVRLTLVSKGGSTKAGYWTTKEATLSTDKPASITKAPTGLTAPQYGTLEIGEGGAGIAFILDEPEGKPPRFFVDANGNGNLTDDPKAELRAPSTKPGEYANTNGTATVNIGDKNKPAMVTIAVYHFDRNDPARAAQKSTLFYYGDYACEGTIPVGGKPCMVLLYDERTNGDFRGKPAAGPGVKAGATGVKLLVDLNGNGSFDRTDESFDTGSPITLGGATWDIADMTRDGTSFRLVKSTKAAKPAAVDHSVGKVITPFEIKDTSGQAVKFPGDYKGKIVLLDFWATWCGPCMGEMPNVVAVYSKYHGQGFEILGVSLDNDNSNPKARESISKMPKVMKDAGMTWRQIADGKGWDGAVPVKYGIHGIPATFLIDGTTGKILGTDLRKEALDKAVEKAIAEMGK